MPDSGQTAGNGGAGFDAGSDLIRIGRVGKPHGVRGGFYVDGPIDASAFVPDLHVWIDGKPFTVAGRAGTDDRPILNLRELSDRDVAAALRGEAIRASRDDLPPLEEDEWYAADLVGLAVRAADGRELGVVRRLVNMPSVDLLEVRPEEGGADVLVPMVHDALERIDLEAGEIVVDHDFLGI